jgi:hypothetical protein
VEDHTAVDLEAALAAEALAVAEALAAGITVASGDRAVRVFMVDLALARALALDRDITEAAVA